jgi:SAM-dependent methyltransferase
VYAKHTDRLMLSQSSHDTAVNDLFETVSCPICGSNQSKVIRAQNYAGSVTADDIRKLYSASSSHVLMDQVVECTSCSLVYVNPRPASELTLSSYSDAVDPVFVSQNRDRIVTFRKTLSKVLHKLGETDGKERRLLDIGCAGGAFPVAARDLGFDPVGVEPSRWLADYGRRTYGLDIRNGILKEGMFPRDSFDVVTLWDVIEHVPDPHQLLTLVNSLLKPGGLLLVNYPDVGSIAARFLGSRWPFWLSVHLLYYTRGTMARQLKQAGFSVQWQQSCSPSLALGYVLQRATPYLGPAGWFIPAVNALGISNMPVTYNMGQTLVVSRK